MKNVPNRAAGEAMPSISRRLFLRSTTGAAIAASAGVLAATSGVADHRFTEEADPIIVEIGRHRAANSAFEGAVKGASDDYLDSEEFEALSDAESAAWLSLIETQPTTLVGLAVLTTYVLHSPALHGDMEQIRALLGTIAIAAAKFASLDEEAGR